MRRIPVVRWRKPRRWMYSTLQSSNWNGPKVVLNLRLTQINFRYDAWLIQIHHQTYFGEKLVENPFYGILTLIVHTYSLGPDHLLPLFYLYNNEPRTLQKKWVLVGIYKKKWQKSFKKSTLLLFCKQENSTKNKTGKFTR